MGNIREKYKVELDNKKEKDKKKVERKSYDAAAYPFGADEMLLNMELDKLEEDLEK